ncbi:MauE/DoxX family redox-associated membrane protein [Actinomadura oligospora]|uniref:MauE/DoxX family redox-associated membrane protein n=1 Tax=Actinomadura oligospora TaxID=111804 RepID=UPI0004B83163|nr:MauE/DoxX family redox-associated membrane protein [Actinomadura oligospora]
MTAGLVLAFAQGAVVLVFGYSGYTKLHDREGFGNFTQTVQMLTKWDGRAVTVLAASFAGSEASTAVLTALPPTAFAGFALATALLTLFIGVILRAVRGRVFAECGCFGGHSAAMSYPLILRNVLLLGFAVPGLLLSATRAPEVSPLAGVAAAAGVGAAFALVKYYDTAVRLVLFRLFPEARASRPEAS